MDYNPDEYGSASARFLLIVAFGLVLMVIMLSILADMVMGTGMVDKLTSTLGVSQSIAV